jgi:NAD(P)-dependent dehydrogenase (short-subunit alcohol dehydrogenase family)
MNPSTARVALITGTNKGIGFEIARRIGATGARVLVGARDDALGEAAAAALRAEGVDALFLRIDLDQPQTIANAAAVIDAEHGRLDILINNAGVAVRGDGVPGEASLEAVRRVFEVNFFSALAVAQAMLPLLRRSSAARVVNVSSGLGSLTRNADPSWEFAAFKPVGYNASKAALNMLTVLLAAELNETGAKVNSAAPGYTATDLNGHRGRQTVAEGAEAAVRLALLPNDGPTGGFFTATGREPW